jgi:hypothetical protein
MVYVFLEHKAYICRVFKMAYLYGVLWTFLCHIFVTEDLYECCVKFELPSVMGVSEEAAMDIEQTSITGGKRYFIDTVNIKVPRKGMDVVPFLKDGMSRCIAYIACCLCLIECCCIFMTCAYIT